MDLIVKGEYAEVLPVVQFSFPPQRAFVMDGDNGIKYKWDEFKNSRSQDLEKMYHDAGQFYFYKSDDFINMPFKNKFKTQTAYYQTLAHELIHSTMKRCKRVVPQTQAGRALEELTAEIGSAYLLAEFGIKADLQNTSAYVQSWIKELKNDTNYIFKASKQAKSAVKYLKLFM